MTMEEELKKQMKAIFELLGDPEVAKSMAKFYRNFYDALLHEGFNEEQAIKIVCSFDKNKK